MTFLHICLISCINWLKVRPNKRLLLFTMCLLCSGKKHN